MPLDIWTPQRVRSRLTLVVLALIVTAAAALSSGTAVAKPVARDSHDSGDHQWHWPGQGGQPGHGHTPSIDVPGIDTTIQPEDLAPPPITVLQDSSATNPGYVFAGPKIVTAGTPGQQGPEIIDNEGQPYFFLPIDLPYQASDFRVQQYKGKPVLTFNVGQSTGGPGHSSGENVLLNQHYQQIATVSAGNGFSADQHEFRLTDKGTALITIYRAVPYDLSKYGGPVDGQVYDGIVQEVDVASGKVLWQWNSLDHVPLSDSYIPTPSDPSKPWDYFHLNAVNPDTDGNLLIDGRGVSTVYKVNRKTGSIIWRLGGKSSDFELGPGVQFNGQHDPLPETGQPNTYRIFDNDNGGGPATGKPSRVIDVRLDLTAKTATLVDSVEHPAGVIANSQGSSQRLGNGDLFVGWGSVGRLSEFDPAGNLLWDAQVPPGYDSYRGYRSPWIGLPLTDPTAEASRIDPTHVDVDAIWNGATEVDRWLILSGQNPHHLHPVGLTDWSGLATDIQVRTTDPYVEIVALDDDGDALGRSELVQVQ